MQAEAIITQAPDTSSNAILRSLEENRTVVLEPADVLATLELVHEMGIRTNVTMLDPWYNKGVGGIRDDYQDYILTILNKAAVISEHVFLWGFPEIVAVFVDKLPPKLRLLAWLSWYYKNNPSVIRGWRSSQMTCLHLTTEGAKLYPEHFLNEVQKGKLAQRKLRYMPGPTSVIEAPLNIGFVGRKEQTGHPAQKPVSVYEKLLMMTMKAGDLVLDPMAGSGTTGEAAKNLNLRAILADHSEEYTQLIEKRLEVSRFDASKTQLT